MAVFWCSLVCSEEGKDGGDIRAGRNGLPVNGTADGLAGGFLFRGVGIIWVRVRDGIDGAA